MKLGYMHAELPVGGSRELLPSGASDVSSLFVPDVHLLLVVAGTTVDVTAIFRRLSSDGTSRASNRVVGDALIELARLAGKPASVASVSEDRRSEAFANLPSRAPAERDALSDPVRVSIATQRIELLAQLLTMLESGSGVQLTGAPVLAPAALRPILLERSPELLLLDWHFAAQLGRQELRRLRTSSSLRVLLICDQPSDALVECLLENRFHGYILDEQLVQVGIRAIHAISRGELWLPRTLLTLAKCDRTMANSPEVGVAVAGFDVGPSLCGEASQPLTARESEIVMYLRRGQTNKEIARQLGIMEDTVKKHLQSVFGKLGVRRRSLVAMHASAPDAALAQLAN